MNFSVLNWNIQGMKYYTSTNFDKVATVLEKSNADIFCFQEAQKLQEKLDNFSRLQKLSRVFPEKAHYRNIILSKFPIISSGELAFPQFTDIPFEFEIVGVGPKQRADQLKFVLSDSKRHIGPVIICGDLNTTIPPAGIKRKIVQWFHNEQDKSLILDEKYFNNDERYVFAGIAEKEGFREATDISKSTWCIPPFGWELFNLKLDWFLVRDAEILRVSLGDYISDHRAISAECLIS